AVLYVLMNENGRCVIPHKTVGERTRIGHERGNDDGHRDKQPEPRVRNHGHDRRYTSNRSPVFRYSSCIPRRFPSILRNFSPRNSSPSRTRKCSTSPVSGKNTSTNALITGGSSSSSTYQPRNMTTGRFFSIVAHSSY